MRKGMILYVTEGKEDVPLQTGEEILETARSLGVTAVCVASSEEDAVHGWYGLVTKGVQQVLFMTVSYNAQVDRFESRGNPVRLCG
ncbi:MAG TPA: hypothetical protein PLM79_10270 [Syntrophobacteraceae bacterium]|nr:hypothetical protein [Syntrophobacteraceae bacterium]